MINPAYLTAIKDDDDIIYDNLNYYYNIGIRDFFIMLHCSDEKTVNEIKRFESDKKTSIHFLIDNDYTFKQELHFKQLSELAWSHGFNWHIASDSDELLVLRKHRTIQEFLSNYPDNDTITFEWSFYSNVSTGKTGNMFLDRKYRRIEKALWTKSIAQWTEKTKLYWVVGQHYLVNSETPAIITSDIAFYAHFPYRSFERWSKRFTDWAVTKQKRFKNDQNSAGWLYEYNQLQEPNFLKKQWDDNLNKEYGGDTINLDTFIFDPLYPDLFN